MNQLQFGEIEYLAAWLAGSGIDVAGWGKGEAKQLLDLWREYTSGESCLTDNPPARQIDVAQVIIRRGDRVLVELAQEFADDRRRSRLLPPSEKLKGGESPRAAAWRCLGEELGLREEDVALGQSAQVSEEVGDSPSYPGLPTRYVFHVFEATADSLPDDDFYRDNAAPNDPIRRHLWGWRRE